MNLPFFGKRQKNDKQQEQDSSGQERSFSAQKRQNLVQRQSELCTTIPQKAVEAFAISTKRFFEWRTRTGELIGTLCLSETATTTRVQQFSHTDQYFTPVPHLYVRQYTLTATKQGGPPAIFEWNEEVLQIRIPLGKKTKTKHTPRK